MKTKIISTITLTLTLLLSMFTPAWAELRAEPVAKSPFDIRGRYQTDLFTGSGVYSYPIKTPKGTNDLTPELSLTYNSAATRDYTQRYGAGWQMSHDFIEQDVNFNPGNPAGYKFKLHFKGGVHDLIAANGRYYTKTETYLYIRQEAGGQNDYGGYWTVIEKDGTKYRFGYSANSETVCNGRNTISRWNLDQTEDTHGNKIFYSYLESGGTAYLAKIEYNNDKSRVVEFNYTANPFQRQAYIQGCSVTDVNRLSSIAIKTNNSLVRQYDLAYTTTSNNQSLLQSITEKGIDATSALAPTTFSYKPQIKSWQSQYTNWEQNNAFDANFSDANVRLIDANGDGFSDVVKATSNGGNNTYRVYKNIGATWNDSPEIWLNNNPMDARLDQFWTRLIDMTGDGLPEIVKATQDTWYVWKNIGSSWNTTPDIWAGNSSLPGFTQTDNHVALIDVNGDGLPDVIKSYPNSGPYYTWRVWKNNGSSFNTAPEIWINNQDVNAASIAGTNVTLADVNGDGLNDIIQVVNNGGPNNDWRVALNTGSDWATPLQSWVNPIDANLWGSNVALVDVNGDNMADIIKVQNNGGPSNDWRVWLNKGNSWESQYVSWVNPIDSNIENTNEGRIAEVNGDGLLDIVRTVNTGGPNNEWRVWLNNGHAPNLLASVKTPDGGTISFDYKSSSSYDNTGGDGKPDLPFPLWLVEKKTENNGMTGAHNTTDITTYGYSGGFYKWQDREFRGFKTVVENLPGSTTKKYVFHQDDALKGLLQEVQTRDNQNNPYSETEYFWNSLFNSGVYTRNLTSEKSYLFDGNASNPKITQTDYQYDTYGNVTKKSELGDTSVSGDERHSYYEYTINTASWIRDTVKHIITKSADDLTKISESWFYYDTHSGIDEPPAIGDITKEIKWLDTSANPVTLYDYDAYGNLMKKTDAKNHITTYTYDTTGTYPVSTKNAINQTSSMSYELGTGNLISKTDPNGFTVSYEYDAFGRITKEIKPYDSSSYPTTNYQYFLDGTAPEGMLVSKRETAGTSNTLDAYTWSDGFGRKIQTRTDAEDPTKQIVGNTYYDPSGEIQKESVPHIDAAATAYTAPIAGIKVQETTYDPLGRITILKNTKGDVKTIAYDHWKETTIDENGHIKREYKNAYDKVSKIEEVNGAETYTTTYEYNARDELTKITDHGSNIFGFTYDTLGRRKSQSDPDMGTWSYEYDAVGNLTKKTDNRGIATNYNYDELDRRTKADYPTQSDTIYSYDGNSKIGTLTSITDVAGTLNFTYDNRLRKTQETRVINGNTWTTAYTYDSLDRTLTRTNPDSQIITYNYNTQGEIDKVTGIINNIDYNEQGKITKKDFANNLTTSYTYNTDDFRLNKIKTGSLFDSSYTYDKVGNITAITDNLISKTQNFGYDDLDRLINAQEAGGYNYAYAYNPIGNLTRFTKNGTNIDYTYGQSAGAHALTSSTEVLASPTPTPTPTPAAAYTFHKGINFNGNSVVIEGNTWASMSNALASGLSIPSGNETANTSLTPNPAVSSDTSHMLNTVVWKNNATLSLDQTLSNGNYQIYFWVMENYRDYNRKFHIKLENIQVATDIGYMIKNNWTKYGPYTTSVGDGVLDIDLINSIDSPHVMGMAIFKATAGGATPTSTPTFTPTPTPTSSPTPTPANEWTYCSIENQTCSFSDTKEVRYGANNAYFYRIATTSISCNNSTFGDPIPNIVKQCHYRDTSIIPTPTPTATPTPTNTSGSVLLSQSKPITASSQKSGFEATKANDGVVPGSYWEALSNLYPSTLTIDLTSVKLVNKVVMKLDWGTRTENVEILGSTDNTNFTTIVPATNYAIGTVPVTFTAVSTRYVRLKINSNSAANSAQMAEFEVWGQ